MMTLGGGRPSSPYGDRDRGSDLPLLHSCPLLCCGVTWAMAVVVITQDRLTSVNDPDKRIRIAYVGRPDALWKLSGCYVCECRVPLLEHIVPSVAFFLLRFFLRVFLLLPSAYLRFLSEALEFSAGDFRVVLVTAFAVFNPIFPVFTRYVRLVLVAPLRFCGLEIFSRVESRVLGWFFVFCCWYFFHADSERLKNVCELEATSSGPCGDAHAKKSVDKLSAKEFRERFCIPNGVSVELTDGEAVSTENNEDHHPEHAVQLDLSLLEVLFIYSIKKLKTDIFNFVACLPSMQLVTNLPDSTKGAAKGHVLVKGKASFDRLNRLFEIAAAERSCDTLLSAQNLRSVMQELQPYVLNILPRRMLKRLWKEGLLRRLRVATTASSPLALQRKKKKKVSKKGKEVKLPTPPKEFVIPPVTYEKEVTIKEPEHPVPPSISSGPGHLAGPNHSGPSMSVATALLVKKLRQ
ncbi:hypothetical protein AAG906_003849 [Vitis piasezkii]